MFSTVSYHTFKSAREISSVSQKKTDKQYVDELDYPRI